MTATPAIKERPILMNAEMIRAVLSGAKTQTRRIAKQLRDTQDRVFKYAHEEVWASLKPEEIAPNNGDNPKSIFGGRAMFDGDHCYSPAVVGKGPSGKGNPLLCPFGKAGDHLWVRESFRIESFGAGVAQIRYAADNARGRNCGVSDRKLPNRIGPVPSIHMPRHCSRITLEIINVRVERLQDITESDAIEEGCQCAGVPASLTNRGAFAKLWESINGAGSWGLNPFVWVIEFQRLQP